MPKYIVERNIPGAGNMTPEQLCEASRESNAVRDELGPTDLQWVNSFVTENKIYCMYIAKDKDIIQEHARCLDIPANEINQVVNIIDPTTGEK